MLDEDYTLKCQVLNGQISQYICDLLKYFYPSETFPLSSQNLQPILLLISDTSSLRLLQYYGSWLLLRTKILILYFSWPF